MMTVLFELTEDCLESAQSYFNFVYEPEWMDDPLVRQMIKDIDKVEMQSQNVGYSPVFGSISPRDLSGGVKGLILILKHDEVREYSSCIFGDNCAEWICKLSTIVDFTFVFEHGFIFCRGKTPTSPYTYDREVLAVTPDGHISRTSEELTHRIYAIGG